MYCNRVETLESLLLLYEQTPPPKNDMEALGLLAQQHPREFYALPTESFQEHQRSWMLLDPNLLGGIFDAAAVGQWILGVDPIHSRFKVRRNGFVNEKSKVDFSELEITAENSALIVRFRNRNQSFSMFNLHLHSKNWRAFEQLFVEPTLLKHLNCGRKSVIVGDAIFRNLIFGAWRTGLRHRILQFFSKIFQLFRDKV
jgi:hypothetical protein